MNTPLNTDLISNPSLWRMSLMISQESLDVFAYALVGETDVLTAHIPFPIGSGLEASTVEDIIYSNPLLIQPFKKVEVVFDGGFTLAVPKGVQPKDIDAIFPSPENESITLTSPLDSRYDLIFRVDKKTYNFVRRTFDNVCPTHSLSVLTRYFTKRVGMGNRGKMYVDLGAKTLNIVVFNQLGAALTAGYRAEDTDTAAYYILAAAKCTGLNLNNDEIHFSGNPDRRAALSAVMRKFARHLQPVIFPGSFYNNSQAMAGPFPLAVLPLCE